MSDYSTLPKKLEIFQADDYRGVGIDPSAYSVGDAADAGKRPRISWLDCIEVFEEELELLTAMVAAYNEKHGG